VVKGYSPLTSGLLFLPFVGCILVSSNVSSIVTLPRFGPRVLIASGISAFSGTPDNKTLPAPGILAR
jgi:hypothetical protein